MADRIITQSKSLLDRLDERFGKDAHYVIVGDTALVNGRQTPNHTTIPAATDQYIPVRESVVTVDTLSVLQNAGISQVETAYKVQTAHVPTTKSNDELHLRTGEKYLVIRSQHTADLKNEWLLFVRQMT